VSELFAREGGDISVAGQRITRDELWARAARVADDVRGASIVPVDATATLDTVVRVVGCLEAGAPFVPIAPDSGPLEREHILRDSDAAPTPTGTACVMYTSGTTGLP
jgi:fatty acid CoA ligase FadD36